VSDLSALAQPLIEHPPCPPPPVVQLQRRITRRRRRRLLTIGAMVAIVAAGLLAVFQGSPTRVVTTGPAAPPPPPADLSVLEPFHPVGPVTVVVEGFAEDVPWQLVVFQGSLDAESDAFGLDRTGPCFLLLDARPGAELPPGAGACDWGRGGSDGLDAATTGHGFAHIDGTTFVTGNGGNAVAGLRVELRDGRTVEVVTHAVDGIDGRYWVAPLPGTYEGQDWLERANETVTAIVPVTSTAPTSG
jgi:hypothetical protein